jgi:hypothetical protein
MPPQHTRALPRNALLVFFKLAQAKNETAGFPESRRFAKKRDATPRRRRGPRMIAALVNARVGFVLQAGDFILHLQLATLQFRDRHVVDRGVRHGVGQLLFQRLVLPFQFRKMRLDGHRWNLLCQIPDGLSLPEPLRQVDAAVRLRRDKSPLSVPFRVIARLDALPLTRDTY